MGSLLRLYTASQPSCSAFLAAKPRWLSSPQGCSRARDASTNTRQESPAEAKQLNLAPCKAGLSQSGELERRDVVTEGPHREAGRRQGNQKLFGGCRDSGRSRRSTCSPFSSESNRRKRKYRVPGYGYRTVPVLVPAGVMRVPGTGYWYQVPVLVP